MLNKGKQLAAVALIALCMGCNGMKTKRVDADYSEKTYTTFSATDLIIVADKMADSLVNRFDFGSQRPLVRIDTVKNKTDEHIDTKSITDSITARILKSGKVRFAVDYSERQAYEKRAAEEGFETRISDEDRQMYLADQAAPRYRIYGELTDIKTITEDTKDVFYKFSLKMVDFKTGVLEWMDEAQLRKVSEKKILGW